MGQGKRSRMASQAAIMHTQSTRRFGIPVQSSLTQSCIANALCMVFVNDRSIEGVETYDILWTLLIFGAIGIAMGV